MRRCASCSAIMSRRRARWSRPSGCASTIAHPKPITRAELEEVEDIANRVVLENAEVTTRLMGLDDARASGARALFGEKYGDEVRVVSMGEIEEADDHERTYSIELCGGTHVHRTGDIGLITIVGESAVAAGYDASRPRRATRRASGSRPTRAATPISRLCCARRRARRPSGWKPDRRQTQARARACRREAQAGDGRRRRDGAGHVRATSPASSFTPAR